MSVPTARPATRVGAPLALLTGGFPPYSDRVSDAEAEPAIPRIEVRGRLSPDEVAAVLALTEAATETDHVSPLSEHVMLHLRYGGEGPDRNLLAFVPEPLGPGEQLAGYAHVDPTDAVAGSAAELVVHPHCRQRGIGRRLVAAAMAESPDGRLRLWAHGDHPAARALALSLGFREVRRLEQLRRSLYSPLPELVLPEGIRLRAFRPGEDDQEWLALNGRAFAGHPEQGDWTPDDLHARMRESWFNPAGFLIAERDGPDRRPQMIGFHWTKVHGGTHAGFGVEADPDAPAHAHEPIGEVYVVGIDPDVQGGGLGRALTLAGLRWLRAQGLPQAMLYVEADNAPALAVYRRLGFTLWDTDVMFYRRQGGD